MENTFERLFAHLLGLADEAPQEYEALVQSPEGQQSAKDICRIINALPYALDLQEAPAALKTRVLSAVEDESRATHAHARETTSASSHVGAPRHAALAGALYIQRKQEGTWVEPGIPGVKIKNLFVDQNTGYTTMLVRMAPEAWFPRHLHAGYEECLMLEGEVSCGDLQLFAGDYQRMTGEVVHEPLHTKTGCMFLVIASEDNKLL